MLSRLQNTILISFQPTSISFAGGIRGPSFSTYKPINAGKAGMSVYKMLYGMESATDVLGLLV